MHAGQDDRAGGMRDVAYPPRIGGGIGAGDFRAVIVRSVAHQDQVKILEVLGQDALDQGGEILLLVKEYADHRNAWTLHQYSISHPAIEVTRLASAVRRVDKAARPLVAPHEHDNAP